MLNWNRVVLTTEGLLCPGNAAAEELVLETGDSALGAFAAGCQVLEEGLRSRDQQA